MEIIGPPGLCELPYHLANVIFKPEMSQPHCAWSSPLLIQTSINKPGDSNSIMVEDQKEYFLLSLAELQKSSEVLLMFFFLSMLSIVKVSLRDIHL